MGGKLQPTPCQHISASPVPDLVWTPPKPEPGCAATPAGDTHLLLGVAGLLGGGRGAQVLVHAVQQPEQELEGVVLRVAPELGAVLGDDVLQEKGREGAQPPASAARH